MSAMTLIPITEAETFNAITDIEERSIIFLWAAWHEQSKLGGQIHQILSALSQRYSNLKFYSVEAEKFPSISESLDVSVVPTFVAIEGKRIISKLEGSSPPEINKFVKEVSTLPAFGSVYNVLVIFIVYIL